MKSYVWIAEQGARCRKWVACGKLQWVALGIGIAVTSAAPSAARAHEPRAVGDGALSIAVGFRDEPAFEDQVNAVDVFVRRSDGSALSGPDDVVDLEIEVRLLVTDSFDASVVDSAALAPPRLAFGRDDRYQSVLRPTADGAYGFRVRGVIHDVSNGADPVEIDEIFVCGGGSQNADGRLYGCVEDVPSFSVLRIERRTGRDLSGYRDTDAFSID